MSKRYIVTTSWTNCPDHFTKAEFATREEAISFFKAFDPKAAWEVENSCSGNSLARNRVDLTVEWEEWTDFGDCEVSSDGDSFTYHAMVYADFTSRDVQRTDFDFELGQYVYVPMVEASVSIYDRDNRYIDGASKIVAPDFDLTADDAYDDLLEELEHHYHAWTF